MSAAPASAARSAATSGGRASRSRPRSRRSPSAPAGGRSSTPSACPASRTTPPSSPSRVARCAGPIADRDGRWLARSTRDANGEAVREYRDDSISHVVGYASRQYGTAGLERTYNAELIGLGGSDPFAGLLDKFDASRRSPLGLQTTLDLRLQHAAIEGLGADHGAVVMLDPSTGDVLALASTPTYDAAAIADPDTAGEAFARAARRRVRPAPASRDDGPLRAGLGVQDRHRDRRPEHRVRSPRTRRSRSSRRPRTRASSSKGSGSRTATIRRPATRRSTSPPRPRSAATSGSRWPASRPGATTSWARRTCWASAQPIPFDLPTAVSRVTDGSGSAPGGFSDDVELASASFGQGETFVTPAADGARGVDRRERRRPDAAAAGQRPDRRGAGRARRSRHRHGGA